MEYKVCSKCGNKYFDIENNFYKNSRTAGGFDNVCKTCRNEQHKRYISKHPDSVKKCKANYRNKIKAIKQIEIINKDNEIISYFDNMGFKYNLSDKLQCKQCGHIYNYTKKHLYKVYNKHMTIKCTNCIMLSKKKEHDSKVDYICEECGKKFKREHLSQKYCSDKCKNRHSSKINEISRRSKLKINGKINWDISLEKLIKRDKGICKICGKPIDINDYVINNDGAFIAGNMYPSIDHIIPVAKGGTHTWNNIQLAHRHCNSIKHDKTVYETNNGQLKLFL